MQRSPAMAAVQTVAATMALIVLSAVPMLADAKAKPHVGALHAAATPAAITSPELRALHVLNRLGYGPEPGDLERVMQMGPEAYIAEQLHPETLAEPEALRERLDALSFLHLTDAQLWQQFGPPLRKAAGQDDVRIKDVNQAQNRLADEAREARLLQAAYSPAQLEQTMVDFWFNHFNVFVDKAQEEKIWIGRYEQEAIRQYALGRFRELLGATARHPAMLYYLDNQQSSAERTDKNGKKTGGLNENYARELMELHTLGVDGGYTQKDVTELARILTGWGYDGKQLEAGAEPPFFFNAKNHDAGEKRFLGQRFAAGGGQEEGERALDLLAASPATAQHLAYQLAQYFVADDPPPALVKRLASRWRETDGDIRAVLATLFAQPEFWASDTVGQKFKTPWQYLVSSLRVSGLPMPLNVKPLFGMLNQNGEPLYGCLTPDGYKNTEAAWLNADAMIYRLNFANALGNGNLPLWQPPPPEKPAAALSAMSSMTMATAELKPVSAAKPQPPDPFVMQAALGNTCSLETAQALAAARPVLRPGLMLGSPEFMRH